MIIQEAKRRFTLIELLVVVSIIAILAALLLPVLSRTRAKAQDITCLANHKQLSMGINVYADDFGGWLPPEGDFNFIMKTGGEPRGFGYLFTGGAMSNADTILLVDPTYKNAIAPAAGNDASFNGYIRDVGQHGHGYNELAATYRFPPINYVGGCWPPPASWGTPNVPGACGGWQCSNTDGVTESIRISDDYAIETQPIRSACMWNPGATRYSYPDGTDWINLWTHRLDGVNMSFTDGSARWIDGDLLYNYETWAAHHWRSGLWRYGQTYLAQ